MKECILCKHCQNIDAIQAYVLIDHMSRVFFSEKTAILCSVLPKSGLALVRAAAMPIYMIDSQVKDCCLPRKPLTEVLCLISVSFCPYILHILAPLATRVIPVAVVFAWILAFI